MNVILLSAGRSSRLINKNDRTPKTFREVNGKRILDWHLLKLNKYGLRNIYLNILNSNKNYLNKLNIINKQKVHFSFEKIPLGTAGGVRKIITKFKLKGNLLVIYGDNLSDCNYKKIIKFHKLKKSDFTIGYYKKKNPYYSGLISLKKDKVISFQEKKTKKNNKIYNLNSGIYLFSVDFFIKNDNYFYDFAKNFIPLVIKKKKKITGYKIGNLYTYDKSYLFKKKKNLPFSFDSL